MFSQDSFNELAIDYDCFIFGDVKLSSGRESHFYDRWRDITGDVALLEKIAGYIIDKTEDMGLEVDSFYGVPEGATSLGFMSQYLLAEKQGIGVGNHILSTGRKFPKKHGSGEENFVVKPVGKTVVLENIVTTGGSAIKELEKLDKAGVEVVGVITLTDRMQRTDSGLSVQELFDKRGVKYEALSNALTLLPMLYSKLKPGRKVKKKLEEEFRKYGVRELSFF